MPTIVSCLDIDSVNLRAASGASAIKSQPLKTHSQSILKQGSRYRVGR